MTEPDEPIVGDSVGGLVGVKLSDTACVTPPMTVVYVYGVTPFGSPTVVAGCPTGPCWTVVGVMGRVEVVIVVDVAVSAGVVIVSLFRY
jgi:hypothetical protein